MAYYRSVKKTSSVGIMSTLHKFKYCGELTAKTVGSILPLGHPLKMVPSTSGFVYGPWADIQKMNHFASYYETQPNDLFIGGYPKAGNHLLSQLIAHIIKESDKEQCHELYREADLGQRAFPFIDISVSGLTEQEMQERRDATADIISIWWHHLSVDTLPFKSINPQTKFIQIIRNPKDVFISGYLYWEKASNNFGFEEQCQNELNLEDMFSYFMRGIGVCGSYFDYYEQWWMAQKNEGCTKWGYGNMNILWIYYEDIINDKRKEIERIAEFIGKNNLDERDYEKIIENTGIAKIRDDTNNNPQTFERSADVLFRKGKNDEWREYLSEKQSQIMDETMFIKWAKNANDIKYYQPLFEEFKQCNIGYFQ